MGKLSTGILINKIKLMDKIDCEIETAQKFMDAYLKGSDLNSIKEEIESFLDEMIDEEIEPNKDEMINRIVNDFPQAIYNKGKIQNGKDLKQWIEDLEKERNE